MLYRPMIPNEFIQRLRDQVPISQIVGRRVSLRRHGREFQACCPFHKEKTPSFTVNDQKGFFHCFGCGAHGDAIGFLKDYENLSYREAVEALARELGMTVPAPTPEAAQRERKRQSQHQLIELATRYFQHHLQQPGGQDAARYLQRRGLSAETVEGFRLGYAPDQRDGLRQALLQRGATDVQLVAAGLAIQPDHGAPYDRFRGRIIFPIADLSGKIIAFGGRLLAEEEKAPKYLNSPETELFHKGSVLYNARNARTRVSPELPLLIVEGYMDVIALAQAGFPTGVAPLGTALTEHHLQLAWQITDSPILCLDGDAAGQRAMWRSAQLALPLMVPGKTLRFCVLPNGEDPDDTLKNHGPEAFRALLETAQPLSRVMVEHLQQETGNDTPEQRAALQAKLEAQAERIRHPQLQQHFRRYFRDQLWARTRQAPARSAQVLHRSRISGNHSGLVQWERQLLRAVLRQPHLWEQPEVEEPIAALQMQDPLCRTLQQWLMEHPTSLEGVSWPPEAVELAQDKTVPLPQAFESDSPQRVHLLAAWHQLMESYHYIQMKRDVELLEQAMAQEPSEAKWQQLQELTQQMLALEHRPFASDA